MKLVYLDRAGFDPVVAAPGKGGRHVLDRRPFPAADHVRIDTALLRQLHAKEPSEPADAGEPCRQERQEGDEQQRGRQGQEEWRHLPYQG